MKSIVNIINPVIRLYVLSVILVFLAGSLFNILGQGLSCHPGEQKCSCENVDFCCPGLCICNSTLKPINSCDDAIAKLGKYKDDEDKLRAAVLTLALGEALTEENIAENQQHLHGSEELKKAVDKGEITEAAGGQTIHITFTPLEQIKKIISEKAHESEKPHEIDRTSQEEYFLKRTNLDGLEKAIEEYKKKLNNPATTPVRPGFFLNLGKDLMLKEQFTDAIKIFSLDVEINKSPEAQKELDKARIGLADELILKGDKGKAATTLNNLIKDKKASVEIKTAAKEKLANLKSQQ